MPPTTPPSAPLVHDLNYVTLAVPDIDAASTDYQRLFGLNSGPIHELPEAGGRGTMLPSAMPTSSSSRPPRPMAISDRSSLRRAKAC